MRVAIHQPNYLPWLGYFDKILRCDVFVFLDRVQMSVQSYTQRVQILSRGIPLWLTVPIRKKGLFGQSIAEVECNSLVPWRRKHLGTIQANYGREAHFREVFQDLKGVFEAAPDRLAALNEELIDSWQDASVRAAVSYEVAIWTSGRGTRATCLHR